MNPDLNYLNQLQAAGMIMPNDYINQLSTMYYHNPDSFSEDEVDFVEKQFKAFDIPFQRANLMEGGESSIASIANQWISGFAEGFTTFGWAEEPDTAAERIAANMGHLAGFAPDLIAAFFTAGASVSLTAAKTGSKIAVKQGRKKVAKALDEVVEGKVPVGQARAHVSAAGGTTSAGAIAGGFSFVGRGISKAAKSLQDVLSEVAKQSEKLGPFKLRKKILNEDGRPFYMLRSIPMRAADVILDNAKILSKKAGITGGTVFDSWLMKKTFGPEAARNMVEEGARLGLALGVSSWKEGPEGMGQAAFHGAMAGAFFGGVGEYVKIGRFFRKSRELDEAGLAHAARKLILEGRKKVKNRSRKISNQVLSRKMNQLRKELEKVKETTIGVDNETFVDMMAKGITGSAFTGIQASMNDLPLPDQLYEYALGFFFGASARSHKDKQYYKYLFGDKTSIRPSQSLEYDLYQRMKTKEFKNLDPAVQDRVVRHFGELRAQTIERNNIIAGNVSYVVREMLKENPALAEKVIAEINFKQKEKSKEVIEFEKRVENEGKDPIEVARETIGRFNKNDLRQTIREEAEALVARKDRRFQDEVKKDIKKEIDREIEPSDEKFIHRQPGPGKRAATIESLTKKARKDARKGKNNYNAVKKTHGVAAARIYTAERKRVQDVLKKEKIELEVAKEWEKSQQAQIDFYKSLKELQESEGGLYFQFDSIEQLKKHLEEIDNPETYADMAIERLMIEIYDKVDLTMKKPDGTIDLSIPQVELKQMLTNWARESEYNTEKFIKRVKEEFGEGIKVEAPMENSIKEFMKVLEHLNPESAPIITRRGRKKDVEVIPEGVEEVEGQSQTVWNPPNKINQIHAIPGEVVRKIILKSWNTKKKGRDALDDALSMEYDTFSMSPKELMDIINPQLESSGFYLFGGSKDTGTLIIQKMPYQTKDKKGKDYIDPIELKELHAELDKTIPVGKEYTKERTANVIWELVENGLIKGDKLTKKSVLEGLAEYKKQVEKTGYKNVVKFNKYQTLAQGGEIPLNPRVFKKILGKAQPEGDPINVWSTVKNNFENLSNLAPRRFEYDGRVYESVEHAYQTLKSGKFDKETYNSPEWKQGWKKKSGLPADKKTNRELMKSIVKESIQQNEEAAILLKQTNKAPLEHNNPSGKQDIWTKEFPKILQEVRAELFPELAYKEHLRAVAVKDLPSSIIDKGEVIKSNNSGTDGVIYVRNDVFDTIANDFGIPIENGFFKPVGFVKARDGKGNIRMKAGGFRAGEKLDKWMKDNDIHYVVYDSAIKVGLNRRVLNEKEFGYNEKSGEWFSKELTSQDIIRMRPEELHINMGVKEEGAKTKGINIIRGMIDKNNATQFSPEHRQALDFLRERALRGDKETNKKFEKQFRVEEGKKEDFDYSWLEVDKLDMDIILEVMRDRPDSAAAQHIIKRVLEADKDPMMRIHEKWDIKMDDAGKNQQLSDILPSINYIPMGYLWKNHAPFVEKALRNYQISRATKMKQDYGFYQKLGGYDAQMRAMNNGRGISNNEFMLASGHKQDVIDVNGRRETLEAAFNEYKRLEQKQYKSVKDKERLKEYEDALTYAITRAPVSGNGGVRILRFAGFLERKGFTVHTNELNDYYLGGADKDADAVHAIQRFGKAKDTITTQDGRVLSLDKVIKDSFRSVQNELELDPTKPGEVTNIKEPKTLEEIGGAIEGKFGFESIFDPIARLEVAQAAYLGKKNMGIVVNGYTRLQWLWDFVQHAAGPEGVKGRDLYIPVGEWSATKKQKKQKKPTVQGLEDYKEFFIHIKDGVKFEDLIKDGYNLINLAADSADYATMNHASIQISKAFHKYFEIHARKEGGLLERINEPGAVEKLGVTKIISGMQSGADMAGLLAGEALGIPTGGMGTKGHRSEAGKTQKENFELAKRFNIEEGASPSFPVRTKANVDAADATIAIRPGRSAGTDGTINYAQTGDWRGAGNKKEGIYSDGHKPILVLNDYKLSKKNIDLIQEFVKKHPGVLNLAGPREGSVPGSQAAIQKLLETALKGKKGKQTGPEAEIKFDQIFNAKHGMDKLKVVKELHDSLWGYNSNNFTPEGAKKIAENYLKEHTNLDHFYTALADKFADIPIEVNPFAARYSKEKVFMFAQALSREILGNPIFKELGIMYPHGAVLTPKELGKLMEPGKEKLLWDNVSDMVGMSYAIMKSQALIDHLIAKGATSEAAHKAVKQVMQETFMIKQDSYDRHHRIKREGLSNSQNKTNNQSTKEVKTAEEVLNRADDAASIQRYIKVSKDRFLDVFNRKLGWSKKEVELAEGVYDSWLMANPILDKDYRPDVNGKTNKELLKELATLDKVINEAILKYGPGYEGKVKGLNEYRELDYTTRSGEVRNSPDLDLETLYSMRAKVINKVRPRVDHLLKSSNISNANRLEYFNFMQNVFDRANALEITAKNYPNFKKIAKSFLRIKATEEIIKEDLVPPREKKKKTQDRVRQEVEEEVIEKIKVETTEVEMEPVGETQFKPKGTKEFPKFKEKRMKDLIERFHLQPVTEKGEVEMMRLLRFLRANPDLVEVIEAEYTSAMEVFKGRRESFGTMTTNDLELFNQYLELRYFDSSTMVRKLDKVMNMINREDARITFGGRKEGFDRKTLKLVESGEKTTTIRTEDWMSKHWFEKGQKEMVVKIGKDYYKVIDRGLQEFNPKDKEALYKSEGYEITEAGEPKIQYKHEKDFFAGKRKMHVIELQKTAPKVSRWSNLSFFKTVAQSLAPFEKRLQFIPDAKILGSDGRLKTYALEVPTSTLEMIRGTADTMHRLNAAFTNYVEKRMAGLFSMLETNDKEVLKDFEIIFDALAWERAYNVEVKGRNRKKQNSERSFLRRMLGKESRQYVEKEYERSQKELKKLEGKTYHIATETSGKKKTATKAGRKARRWTLERLKKEVDGSMTNFLTEINTRLVQSKMSKPKSSFERMLITELGFKKDYQNTDIDLEANKEQGNDWILRMNELFLDKNGIINEAKIDAVYKGMEFVKQFDTQVSIDKLPSINDVLYFNYHIELKSIAKRVLGEKATSQQIKKFVQEYIKDNPMQVHKVGQFVDKNGKSSLYFPQLGHFETNSKRTKLQKWMKKIIDAAGKVTLKDLPAPLKDKVFSKELTLEEARKDYQMFVKNQLELRQGSSIYHEGLENYRTVAEMISTRPKSWAGNYKAGNLKSRSEGFLPYWRTDIRAIEDYGTAITKNFFDINAGIRMHSHIKHFEKARPFGDFTENWSAYMKDAASNMLGYNSLRSIDMHGIKKSEVALLKKFVDAGIPTLKDRLDKMGTLQPHEKRFLQDVMDYIEPDRVEQYILRDKYGKNKKAIERELQKMRLKNAKDLLDPKNIDKIGKFKIGYSLVSDEAWVNLALRFEEKTGITPWFAKDLPKGESPEVQKTRRILLARKLQAFSAWEAKFELISLLSHPKTTITNFLGGTQNLYADVGAMNIYRATKFGGEQYLLNEIGLRGKEFTSIDARGNRKKKKIETYEDILAWIESTGALEGMFVTEIGLSNTLRKGKATRFATELTRRIFTREIKEHPEMLTDRKVWEERVDLTLRELRKELQVGSKAFAAGAKFMSWSEYQLRTRSFLAHYLNARQLYTTGMEHSPLDFMEWNDAELVHKAIKGVEASQFMYHAAHRSNYSQTSMGRVMTRFHPYAWNSMSRRFGPKDGIYTVAAKAGWDKNVYATKRAQRQFTMDLMAMSLSYVFMSSIFEYALSPPMSWMQDTAQWVFGDEKERERAFFSQWPHPALAPLSIVTPPIARTVLAPTNAFLSGDWDKFAQFYGWTYLPFGRLIRDVKRTVDSPAMAVDFMTGVPLHQIHRMRRDQIEENEAQNEQDEE